MIPRPKSFAAKLLLLFVLVVATAQIATGLIIFTAHNRQARSLVDEELQRAARAFTRVIAYRNEILAAATATAARDYAFKQLFADEIDAATIGSSLRSIRIQTRSDVMSAISLDGRLIATTSRNGAQFEDDIYKLLVTRADADPSPMPTATGYGYLEGRLYSLVIAPVRTPDIVAWLLVGFHIDADFARSLKEQSGIELSVFNHQGRPLASTLPEVPLGFLTQALPQVQISGEHASMELELGSDTALVLTRRLAAGNDRFAQLVLQYSLDEKLAPARVIEGVLLFVTGGALLLAVLVSRVFARRLTRPIIELVGHTRRIADGDYNIRNKSYRSDELGRLSEAFDKMSLGLAERDRVRDLLDKNVSPEVAAQLLRDGATLGGEVREVTILFVDIRDFTTMSEQLSPRDLLALLNRYLDRMSAEIEFHGGVIDKFVGDAIMALFGAPLAQSDAADRALAAALAMQRALAKLNEELVNEGRPTLSIGIGINTADVVAGNMGSHRRQNYSVVGDGVNVASRMQSLTRVTEYRAHVITSAATLAALREPQKFTARPLGLVQVKGRAAPVEIFAID